MTETDPSTNIPTENLIASDVNANEELSHIDPSTNVPIENLISSDVNTNEEIHHMDPLTNIPIENLISSDVNTTEELSHIDPSTNVPIENVVSSDVNTGEEILHIDPPTNISVENVMSSEVQTNQETTPIYPPINVSVGNVMSSDVKMNQEVVHKEPPRYGFINPAALNRTNTAGPNPLPQMQWNAMNNMGTIYGNPSPIPGDMNQIESYLVWSVINILCCCLCLGFIACYFSSEVDSAKKRGDLQGALGASKSARNMNIITTIVGIIILTLYGLYYGGILGKF